MSVKDLLQHPETYHYSLYNGVDYIETYLHTKTDKLTSFFENNSSLSSMSYQPFEDSLLNFSLSILQDSSFVDDVKSKTIKLLIERKQFIQIRKKVTNPPLEKNYLESTIITCNQLEEIIRNHGSQISTCKHKADVISFFLKRFEVQKRIFAQYTLNPIRGQGSYVEPEPYVYLSHLLCKLYTETHNLKYLNTLLKLNDTLASMSAHGYLTDVFRLYCNVVELCELIFLKQIWTQTHD